MSLFCLVWWALLYGKFDSNKLFPILVNPQFPAYKDGWVANQIFNSHFVSAFREEHFYHSYDTIFMQADYLKASSGSHNLYIHIMCVCVYVSHLHRIFTETMSREKWINLNVLFPLIFSIFSKISTLENAKMSNNSHIMEINYSNQSFGLTPFIFHFYTFFCSLPFSILAHTNSGFVCKAFRAHA